MANVTFEDLFSQGTLVDLSVGVWSGLLRVRPDDLGVEKTKAVAKALTFGHERLVSKEFLQPLRTKEHEARKAVDSFSIPFPLVQGSRYVPKVRREELDAKLSAIRAEFMAEVGTFVANYKTHVAAMKVTLRKALQDAARNTAAVDGAMDRIEGSYPTAAKIAELMYMSWSFFAMGAPQDGSEGVDSGTAEKCIADMVTKLREEVDSKMGDVLQLVARGGKLTQKTYNSAVTVCDRLESLNIFADKGLGAAINKMRAVISKAAAFGVGHQLEAGEILINGLEPLKAELAKSAKEATAKAAESMAGKSLRKFVI